MAELSDKDREKGRPAAGRRGPGRGPVNGGRGAPGRGAPAPESREDDTVSRATALALSAWDLARTRRRTPDTSRGQVMTLRTHKRLLEAYEQERGIPEADRSYVRLTEDVQAAVLLLHGVSTRPGDLHVLAGSLHEAGLNVYVLRLPDYGRPEHTISEVSWEAALEQVRQRFGLLARGGGKVHVVGLGFGATLALHLASVEKVTSLVLLSPAIMPRESLFQRILVRLRLHRAGFVRRWVGWNADIMEGMDRARGKIGGINVPIYAAQCDDDDRASPESLRVLQRKAHHPESRFRVFAEGGHAILTTHGEETLFGEIIRFCTGH